MNHLRPNGMLLGSENISAPANMLSMARRSLSGDEFQRLLSTTMHDISYSSEGRQIKGFMAIPPSDGLPMPFVVFNRGGSGVRGALTPTTFFGTAMYYCSWGYGVVASQYRGQGGSEGIEEWGAGDVHDAENLIPLLQSLGYVDMDRLGLVGGSRGGMVAYLMLKNMNVFRAAATICAPAALHEENSTAYIVGSMSKYLPKNADIVAEALRRSAAAWAEELCKTTPLLILHGTGDRRVSPLHSLKLAAELQKLNFPYKLIMYDNSDHVLAGRREESNRDIRWWLDYYVRDKNPLPKTGPHGA